MLCTLLYVTKFLGSGVGSRRRPLHATPADDVHQAIDIGDGIEHAEGDANSIPFRGDTHSVPTEVVEPFDGG